MMRISRITTLLLMVCSNCFAVELRVLTYNVHHAEGTDGKLDLDRIVEVIRAADADVVCLQEVDQNLSRTERMDMPALFREKLDMAGVFGANYHFDGGHYGNLTLSRYPIVFSENIALPNPFDKEPRGCLRIDIRISEGSDGDARTIVTVYNTHLGLNGEERQQQAGHIVSLAPLTKHIIVAGDFNRGPAFMDSLAEKWRLHSTGTTAIPTRQANQLDYILMSEPPREVEVMEAPVRSDHRVLLASLPGTNKYRHRATKGPMKEIWSWTDAEQLQVLLRPEWPQ